MSSGINSQGGLPKHGNRAIGARGKSSPSARTQKGRPSSLINVLKFNGSHLAEANAYDSKTHRVAKIKLFRIRKRSTVAKFAIVALKRNLSVC